jgi:hypothetical protein
VIAAGSRESLRSLHAAAAIVQRIKGSRFILSSKNKKARRLARLQNSFSSILEPFERLAHGRCHSVTQFLSRRRAECQAMRRKDLAIPLTILIQRNFCIELAVDEQIAIFDYVRTAMGTPQTLVKWALPLVREKSAAGATAGL